MVALLPTLIQIDKIITLMNKAVAAAARDKNMDLLKELTNMRDRLHQIVVHPEAIANGTIQLGSSKGMPSSPLPINRQQALEVAKQRGAIGNLALEFTAHNGNVIPTNIWEWTRRVTDMEITMETITLLHDTQVIDVSTYESIIKNLSRLPTTNSPQVNAETRTVTKSVNQAIKDEYGDLPDEAFEEGPLDSELDQTCKLLAEQNPDWTQEEILIKAAELLRTPTIDS